MKTENATNVIKASCVLHKSVHERDGYNHEEESLPHDLEQAQWSDGRAHVDEMKWLNMAEDFVTGSNDLVLRYVISQGIKQYNFQGYYWFIKVLYTVLFKLFY